MRPGMGQHGILNAIFPVQVSEDQSGTAVQEDRTLRVDDVHAFPGHIACDGASRSEIVVPLRKEGVILGVMDLDSPRPARFTAADQAGLEAFARLLGGCMVLT